MSDDLLKTVETFRTLDEVLRWALAREPQGQVVDVVAQDEFTHDVVLRRDEENYLVFDTT